MDVNVCSLSGETITTLKALPCEIVADLKEKLDQEPHYDVQLLLDGIPLAENTRMDELRLDATTQLHMIRSCKSAREILFNSPAVALDLAKHYDSLQDQCAENIGTLFLDEQGSPRTPTANVEVVIALCQKLSVGGFPDLEDALVSIALEALREPEDAPPGETARRLPRYHVQHLLRCFARFGPAAIHTLLGQASSGLLKSYFDSEEAVRSMLISEFAHLPIGTLDQLLCQHCVVPDAVPQAHYRSILESAREAAKIALERKARHTPEYLRVASPRTATRDVARMRDAQAEVRAARILNSGNEVLEFLKRRPCTLQYAENECKVCLCAEQGHQAFSASLSAVLAAIEEEPETVLPYVQCDTRGYALALAAVEKCQGVYHSLPEALKMSRGILYAALERDPALRVEFLSTAGKTEISEWQWHVNDAAKCRKRKKKH